MQPLFAYNLSSHRKVNVEADACHHQLEKQGKSAPQQLLAAPGPGLVLKLLLRSRKPVAGGRPRTEFPWSQVLVTPVALRNPTVISDAPSCVGPGAQASGEGPVVEREERTST